MKRIVSFLGLCAFVLSIASAQMTPDSFRLYVNKIESNGSIKLSWEKPRGVAVDRYIVYRSVMPDSMNMTRVDSTKDTTITTVVPTTIAANVTYVFSVVARTVGGTLLKSTLAFVSLPGISIEGSFRLTARFESSTGKVMLSWNRPPVPTISTFSVYRSSFPDTGTYALLTTTSQTEYIDTPPVVAPGVTKLFLYKVKVLTTGNTPLFSTIGAVSITGKALKDTLKFVSVPPTSARAGALFTYQAKVVSTTSSAIIRYELDHPMGWPMTGMDQIKIDGVTGIITWTPASKGWYSIKILATSDKGGTASQEFQIVVTGANGVLIGTVKDTTDKPLFPVVIEVFKRDAILCFSYATVTDKFGNYRLNHLDTGSYTIAATPLLPNLVGQWYNGKKNANEATVVHVEDSTKSIAKADFKLRYRDSGVRNLTVKGFVADTLGLPIAVKSTTVFFVRADFALNSCNLSKDSATTDDFRRFFDFDKATDFRLMGTSQYVFRADVDPNGAYHLTLPQGSYIAFARAPGYTTDFYRDHDDFLSADVLTLAADSAGINFTLSSLPPIVLGEISGTVSDTANDVGIRAHIIAYRDHWKYAEPYVIGHNYVTDTDTLGRYTLSDLLPGWYVVLALPVGNFAPAFYNSGTQSIGWQKATRIQITGNAVSDINIYTHPVNRSTGGITAISGHVGVKGGPANAVTAAGLSGAMIYAVAITGEVAGYGISDASGNFLVNGLAPGTYSVLFDKPGYSTTTNATASPTYDLTGRPITSTVSFTASQVTAVPTQQQTPALPAAYMLEQNFPNPFNPATTIRYALPEAGFVTLRVFNILGQEVMTLVNAQQTAGTFQVTFDAGRLASGIYIYQLQAGSTIETKKMMLVK